MTKILSLTSRNFFKGIGSPYDINSGLFEKAEGIDLMKSPGLLAAGFIATDLDSGGTVVTDNILWLLHYPQGGICIGYGDTGRIYSINTTTDAVTLLQATANSEGQGAEIQNKYLVYAQDTQVGKYPLAGGAFDDDGISGAAALTDISYHPIAKGADGFCYVADHNGTNALLHKFKDVLSAPSSDWTASAFTLPIGYTIVTHINDGRYHIIGTVEYPSYITGTTPSGIRIFYWDYVSSSSWLKDYILPSEAYILYGLKKKGDWIYAYTNIGVYKFNLSYSPEPIVHTGSNITNLYCQARQGGIDEWKGHLLWAADNVWALGPPYPGYASFLSNPLRVGAGISSPTYALKVISLNKVYVSGTAKLYAFKTSNSSATATTVPQHIISRTRWEIVGLKIVMQTAGEITASIQNSAGTAIITDTISASGFITARGTANPVVDQFIISLTINSGATIKQIEVFANPTAQEYA